MEKPQFYRVIYEGKEKPKQEFLVTCIPHGKLGIISSAVLGLALFEEHRQRTDGCLEATIKPLKEVSWLQRKSMRRVTKSGKR